MKPRYNVVHKVKEVLKGTPGVAYSIDDLQEILKLSRYEIKYALTNIEDSEYPHYEETTGEIKLKKRQWRYVVPHQVLEAEAKAMRLAELFKEVQEVIAGTAPVRRLKDKS